MKAMRLLCRMLTAHAYAASTTGIAASYITKIVKVNRCNAVGKCLPPSSVLELDSVCQDPACSPLQRSDALKEGVSTEYLGQPGHHGLQPSVS